MSGDGVAGGAFMAGFTVVPYGNIVYARPDYVENPLLPSTLSNGSLAKPYPVLAPEGDPNTRCRPTRPTTPTAAEQHQLLPARELQPDLRLQRRRQVRAVGPLRGLAARLQRARWSSSPCPALPQRNPITGAGHAGQPSCSRPRPATTAASTTAAPRCRSTRRWSSRPGSTLKCRTPRCSCRTRAAPCRPRARRRQPGQLHVVQRRQRSAAPPTTTPTPRRAPATGAASSSATTTRPSPRQQRRSSRSTASWSGLNGGAAISGAARRDVDPQLRQHPATPAARCPQSSSNFFSGITLFNSRPTITNATIADTGGTGGTEAAIGADLDSFREDDTARGPLIRQRTVDGQQPERPLADRRDQRLHRADQRDAATRQPGHAGRIAELHVLRAAARSSCWPSSSSARSSWRTPAARPHFITNRLYIQPGVMMKFNRGSGLDVLNPGASLNVGSRSYINGFDQDNSYGPDSPGFVDGSGRRSRRCCSPRSSTTPRPRPSCPTRST